MLILVAITLYGVFFCVIFFFFPPEIFKIVLGLLAILWYNTFHVCDHMKLAAALVLHSSCIPNKNEITMVVGASQHSSEVFSSSSAALDSSAGLKA